jgi:FMN phosphatase YigB (HAD superfamily)
MSLSELAAIDLNDFDLVSTDVFDTILLRDFSSQTQRFAEIAERVRGLVGQSGREAIAADTLAHLRLLLHGSAYRAVAVERPLGDATLDQMHDLQSRLLGGDTHLARQLAEADLAVERQRLSRNDRLFRLLHRMTAAGKRIVAVSDTYYSAAEIDLLLTSVAGDHPIAKVYASSDQGLTKHAGALFAQVARLEGVETRRILHFGDDFRADVQMARAAGCHAVQTPRPITVRFARNAAAGLYFASHMRMMG